MFEKIIHFSLSNKLIIGLGTLFLAISGIYYANQIPLDAVPDITNNQVQVVSTAPTFAPQEVEQLITFPLEAAMTNLPYVEEVRSISRYGLSVITVVFEEDLDILKARQYCKEQLDIAKGELPIGVEPELMPITTGLGEIYQYVLTVDPQFKHLYSNTELRTIQDWIIKRQLNGTKQIIETSSFGGKLKQYEVSVNPYQLQSKNIHLSELIEALEKNNANSGGSYIEKGPNAFYIRTEGRAETLEDIRNTLITTIDGQPITVGNVAQIKIGSAKRYGAMTMDGKGEVVGGITLMLKGANSSEALKNVKTRIEEIKKSLPEGISIYPYLDRSKLIDRTINTVSTNLIEGGLIVIFVLFLLLGNFRAGIIVASVIPLSLLFAMICMRAFGISANLMSLGAIDFGIVVDGAVIIVESILHVLTIGYLGKELSRTEMDDVIRKSSSKIYRSAAFGVLIILLVFIPILTLDGVEGRTFKPMAQTVSFAILGSLILSLTYVPMMASILLKRKISTKKNKAELLIERLNSVYQPTLKRVLNSPKITLTIVLAVFAFSAILFSRMGAEFVPTLEEGDMAMQLSIKPGSSLQESISTCSKAEEILKSNFPEVLHVVSKIGTAEVPTDPMAIEDADVMILMKDKDEWTSASTREELVALMKEKLAVISWASIEFTQPIQLRFNELMTGAKSDISIKLFGENTEILKKKADEVALLISNIEGAADIKVDQTQGLQQLNVKIDRKKAAQFGVQIEEINTAIRAAFAGEYVGQIFEEERKFDLVVRYNEDYRNKLDLSSIYVSDANDRSIPISSVANVQQMEGPMLISREHAKRFINVGINVRDVDVATLVKDIQDKLDADLKLPSGYSIKYGGQFENLENASKRLMIAVPVALAIIFLLLFMAFGTATDAAIIFMAVPLSAIGGIFALLIRDMPFSISSGIGFIALFGVSVLNGIVLISAIKESNFNNSTSFKDLLIEACTTRLRPVLITALVAALGFIPMALSTGSGAEVQRPLATVVIGGLISSTLLTLIVLPTIYYLLNKKSIMKITTVLLFLILGTQVSKAQTIANFDDLLDHAIKNNIELSENQNKFEQLSVQTKANNALAPTEFSYSGGQLNTSDYDNQFVVNQDVSPLFRRGRQQDILQNITIQTQLEKQRLEVELKRELSLAYNQWLCATEVHQWYSGLAQDYQEVFKTLEAQYQAGDIDGVEWMLAKNELSKARLRIINANAEILKWKQQIYRLALLPSTAEITDTNFVQLTTISPLYFSNFSYSNYHNLLNQSNLSKAGAIQKIEASPNISVGYFHQSLEKEYGFQGVNMGLSIPIDRKKSKAIESQAIIQSDIISNRALQTNQDWALRVIQLEENLEILQLNKAFYTSNFNVEFENNYARINQKLSSGEIDLLKYSQYLTSLIETKDNYLHWIKTWNINQIETAFYTQTK